MTVNISPELQRWIEAESHRRIDLGYLPFPKQEQFHRCAAKYRLFGGAAGPGKSKALLMEAIVLANKYAGSNTLLLRRTFPELEGSLLLYFRRDVPREFYRSFNEAKHTVTWHNGSTTRFGYSQNENDIYQYQSSEFLFIGIDELTHFTLRQWQFLTSRNRCPVPGSRPNMAGATNPGNIGHAWVKSLFIDKQPAPGMETREYDANDYAFISARVTDNPIYANDPSYMKTLQQLPDFYRRAFLDGDWSVFAGQYFTNFDPSRSVIRAEAIAAEKWWPRWISVDWGFEHPAAVYWHTAAPNFHTHVDANSPFAGATVGSPGRGEPRPYEDNVASRDLQIGANADVAHVPFRDVCGTDMKSSHADADDGGNISRQPARNRRAGRELQRTEPRAERLAQASACVARDIRGRGASGVFASDAQGGPEGSPYDGAPSFATNSRLENLTEEQRHRLGDFQTHESGACHSANNMANPTAGDAALREHCSRDEFYKEAGRASRSSDAPAFQQQSVFAGALHQGTRPALRVPNAAAPTIDVSAGSGFGPGHSRADAEDGGNAARQSGTDRRAGRELQSQEARATTITYREFIAQHLAPRILAAQIIERSHARDGSAEKIDAIYLSPDAFARRTDESSIAEQMGDILQAAGLPRPVPADNDRISGWMLMYQMLDAHEWLIADSCSELIRTLPELVRDAVNVEDIAKRDGDDAADAARYGLKSRASAQPAKPPRDQEFQQRVTSSDPTIRAIQIQKANLDLRSGAERVVPRPGAKQHSRRRWLW